MNHWIGSAMRHGALFLVFCCLVPVHVMNNMHCASERGL